LTKSRQTPPGWESKGRQPVGLLRGSCVWCWPRSGTPDLLRLRGFLRRMARFCRLACRDRSCGWFSRCTFVSWRGRPGWLSPAGRRLDLAFLRLRRRLNLRLLRLLGLNLVLLRAHRRINLRLLRLRRLAVGGLVVLLRRRCRLLRCRLHALVRGPALLDAAAWLCRRIAVDWSLAVANRGAPQERGNGRHYQITGAQGCLRQIGLGALRVRQPSIVNCI